MRPPAITTAAVDARGPTVAHVHSRTLLSSGGQASREAGAPREAYAGSVMQSQKRPETHGQRVPSRLTAETWKGEGTGRGQRECRRPSLTPAAGWAGVGRGRHRARAPESSYTLIRRSGVGLDKRTVMPAAQP